MKKIKLLVLSLLCLSVILFSVGCGSTAASLTPDTSCWGVTGTGAIGDELYEKSVFSVKKVDTQLNKTIATGTLTYTLEYYSAQELTLSADFSITYNDDAPVAYRNTTDTITSTSWFNARTLLSSKSTKTIALADRDGEENKSYTIVNDYNGKKSTLTWDKKDDTDPSKVHELKFSAGTAYDSEMLYYVVRAFDLSSTTTTFNVASLFDAHINGGYSATPMIFSLGDTSQSSLPADKFATYLDEQGSVMLQAVKLSIDSDFNGPPIHLKYSKTPFKVGARNNEKVLVYIRTDEYDVANTIQTYYTEYNLIDYSAQKGV